MDLRLVFEFFVIGFSIFTLFICGVMESIGTRMPILILNRVPPRRMIAHLLGFGVVHVIGHLIWAVSIWLIVRYLYGRTPDPSDVILLVTLSYLPFFFGFIFLLPYLGPWIAFATGILSLGIAILVTGIAFDLNPFQAILCVLAGWLLLRLLERIENGPTHALNNWFWGLTTGQVVRLNTAPPILLLEPLEASQTPRKEISDVR